MSQERINLEPSLAYWASLKLPRGRATEESVRFAIEPLIPVGIDEVVVRHVRIDREVVLACAIERDLLRQVVDQGGADVESITPAGLPDWLMHHSETAYLFEFRDGEFESLRRKGRRRFAHAALLVWLVLISGCVALGLRARSKGFEAQALALEQRSRDVASTVLGHPNNGVDPLLLLTAEDRRLELARASNDAVKDPESVLGVTIDVLANWPEGVPVRVDALSLSAARLSVSGALPSADDFDSLRAGIMGGIGDWFESSSDLRLVQREYRFSLVYLRPEQRGAP